MTYEQFITEEGLKALLCDCGSIFSKRSPSVQKIHKKTLLHIKYIETPIGDYFYYYESKYNRNNNCICYNGTKLTKVRRIKRKNNFLKNPKKYKKILNSQNPTKIYFHNIQK